jgi:3-hydroxymyristoyl/3-hydroxydecanoyl-(acyl carrier protein) dehydratase
MSADNISLNRIWLPDDTVKSPVAFHHGRYVGTVEFQSAIAYLTRHFKQQPFHRYALFTVEAYPFAVHLLALLQASKEVWIPGNNLPGTAEMLQQSDCLLAGDWAAHKPFADYQDTKKAITDALLPLDTTASRLVMFTSGSTGEPKPVVKCLEQFEKEIAVLEGLWGQQLGAAEILATVSHQHIYGLLFRILWPLAAGRCFHSESCLNPELLAESAKNRAACWIASPAHLKRLDHESPWLELAGLSAIFSSGGALPEAARQQISQHSGQQVVEIYGSTETGGIAWKTQGESWSLFPGLALLPEGKRWRLSSPYLVDNGNILLEDEISFPDDGRFQLHGRTDRIVKIEEKRLALTELERRLSDSPWIEEAYGVKISQVRDTVCVALALTEQGWQALSDLGRSCFIGQVKKSLEPWFETVFLPRKWLFVNSLPLTPQGKIDGHLLTSLLASDKRKFPLVHQLKLTGDSVELALKVPKTHELSYFPNHFPGYPILPGVVQLAWVEHFGTLFFPIGGINRPFSHLEVVKFINIIRPETEMILNLRWNSKLGELQFKFSNDANAYSSGKMLYKI